MKKKLFNLSLCMVVLTGVIIPASAFASSESVSSANVVMFKHDIKNYANQLEPYVHKDSDGTIYLDRDYKNKVNVPSEVIESIQNWMDGLNEDVKAGLATIDDNLKVEYKNHKLQVNISSGGSDDFQVYWWGFGLYLSHATVKSLTKALAAGAATTKLVEIIAKRIPHASAKVVAGYSEVATWLLGTGALTLASFDDGDGILITCDWPGIPVGIEPQ
ncbi:hypothetical protein C2W64_02536 [Brevibacillus laterosporus]|nr:hypothetical protein [Brevibacillus laterosporus]RAP29981.1 hypothetical protein C2W64_02536 [Brevibacillus laterosporus]